MQKFVITGGARRTVRAEERTTRSEDASRPTTAIDPPRYGIGFVDRIPIACGPGSSR